MTDATFDSLVQISHRLEEALNVARSGDGAAEILASLEQRISQAAASPAPAGGGGGGAAELSAMLTPVLEAKDNDTVLEATADALMTATGAQLGFFLMLEGRSVRYKLGRGDATPRFLAEPENQTAKLIVNRVLKGQEGLHAPEGVEGDQLERSIIALPVVLGGRFGDPELLGLWYCENRSPRPEFSEDHFARAEIVLDVACVAMEGYMLIADTQSVDLELNRSRGNLDKLLDVSRRISSTLDLDELLGLIVDKALEVTMANRGYIMLVDGAEEGSRVGDGKDHELEFRVGRAWNGKLGDARKGMSLNESQFFFSKTIANRVMSEAKPVCLTDALGDGGADASVSIVQMELQSVMCAPLMDGDKVMGLVYVDSRAKNREFGPADLDLFEGLAGQAAIALKNAFLYAAVGEQARMKGELDIASNMQMDLLPKEKPQVSGLEVAGFMQPAKEVGGDYYDWLPDNESPESKVSLIIGDVSGKGLGAGIVAVMARCNLRSMLQAYGTDSPCQILTFLNLVLTADTKPGKFMTMLLMGWNSATRQLTWSSAGHEHILHWKAATNELVSTRSGGTALGILASAKPTPDAVITMAPGDTMLLYTDGVTEAMNEKYEEYELERLEELYKANANNDPETILKVVNDALTEFRGKAEQSDDITMIALRCTA